MLNKHCHTAYILVYIKIFGLLIQL